MGVLLERAQAELRAAGRDFDRALKAFAELEHVAQDRAVIS